MKQNFCLCTAHLVCSNGQDVTLVALCQRGTDGLDVTLVVLCQRHTDGLEHHHSHDADWNHGWADMVFLHGHLQQTNDNGQMVGANGWVIFEVCSHLDLGFLYVFLQQDYLLLHVGSGPWTWDECLQQFQYCSSFLAYYESLLYVPFN